MAESFVHIPVDTANTGKYIRATPHEATAATSSSATPIPVTLNEHTFRLAEEDRALLAQLLTTNRRQLAATMMLLSFYSTKAPIDINDVTELADSYP